MRFGIFLVLVIAMTTDTQAVTIAWSPVGNPGNAADPANYNGITPLLGAVAYSYSIGTYDVTNAQYAEFLNDKDPTGTNSLGLYSAGMGTTQGGISYSSASPDGSKFSLILGHENWPVNYITWYDAARFANWMNNGQGNGDTENGSYTLLGGTPIPTNANSIIRTAQATIVIPTENEWYKAAYYNPATSSYFKYPTSSDTAPRSEKPPGGSNSANYGPIVNQPTDVGAYVQSASPYGTFDQGGNVGQWTEGLFDATHRSGHGDPFGLSQSTDFLLGAYPTYSLLQFLGVVPDTQAAQIGFRLAMVPEPNSVILAALGLLGLLAWDWRRNRT